MKFTGKNFQPWPDFDLEINGLTIVIGPSNEGKSSIYRALRGVLRNDLDAAYVRNPKDEPLELEVEVGGHTVKAIRSKKGSVKYIIDGKEYAKLAGDVPEIIKELKFGEIKLGDFTFDPIFASQNRPQFLIDDEAFKPSEINALLGAFGGTEKLEFGKKQANLLKTQKDGEARVLAAQIRSSEDRKARLEVMSASAHTLGDELTALELSLRKLEAETHWLNEGVVRLYRLEPIQEIIDSLILPDATEAESLYQISVFAEEAAFASTFAQWMNKPLQAINRLPDYMEIERLHQTSVYAEQAAFTSGFARWMNKPLQAIEVLEESWSGIVGVWKQIRALGDTATLIDSQIDTSELANFRIDIAFTDLNQLKDSITHLEIAAASWKQEQDTAGRLAAIDEEISTAHADLASTQKALHEAALEAERKRVEEMTASGLCPKCGKSMEHVCQ